jgi:hypothetical protein
LRLGVLAALVLGLAALGGCQSGREAPAPQAASGGPAGEAAADAGAQAPAAPAAAADEGNGEESSGEEGVGEEGVGEEGVGEEDVGEEGVGEEGVGEEGVGAAGPRISAENCDELYRLYEICYGGGVGRSRDYCAGLAEDIARDQSLPTEEARAIAGFCGAACLAGASRYGLMPFPTFSAEYCGR